MKPLPVIDVAMLWVARVFGCAVLAYVALVIWSIYTDDDTRILAEYEHRPIFTGEDLRFIAACSVWGVTLLLCTWYKPAIITRTILGISAGFLAYLLVEICAINSPLHTAIVLRMPLTIWDFTLPALFLMAALSKSWLAIRAGKIPHQFR